MIRMDARLNSEPLEEVYCLLSTWGHKRQRMDVVLRMYGIMKNVLNIIGLGISAKKCMRE